MDYRLSVNYLNQNGIIQGTNAQRVALGLNYNQRLFNDRLICAPTCGAPARCDQFTPGGVLSNAAQMGPTQPVKDPTTPTGFLRLAGEHPPVARQPGRHPGPGHGQGHDLPRHRQHVRPSTRCRSSTGCAPI